MLKVFAQQSCLARLTGERMYAHGGIVAAAASILQDMDQHNLLPRLLEEYDPYDGQRLQPDERSVFFFHPCALLVVTVVGQIGKKRKGTLEKIK